MSELRRLEPVSFETLAKPASDLGPRGELKWIPISQIFIDPAYQRDVGAPGRKNIKQIVERFHWALFSPVIVARRGPNSYAAIDGQHRAIAALTHGNVPEVPCWIIPADPKMEAKAFAVINGNVTATHTLQVFRAKTVAGDEHALRVVEVAREAGVTIRSGPTGSAQLKHGETISPTTIGDCLARFGRVVTIAALNCITRTGDNPGMINSSIVAAFAEVLATSPKWRSDKKLFSVIAVSGVRPLYREAYRLQVENGGALRFHLVAVFQDLLKTKLGPCSFVPLPPSPAEIARVAARKAGEMKDHLARAGRAGAAVSNTKPRAPIKKAVAIDTKAAIADFIAAKGVRKLEPGATADPSLVLNYLQRKGYAIEAARKFQYRYGRKLLDIAALLALADKERAKEGLAPLRKAGVT